jgi:hypothetical protein
MYFGWGNYFNCIRIGCDCVVSATLGDVSIPPPMLEQALDLDFYQISIALSSIFLKAFFKKVSFKLQKGTVVLIQDLY